MQKADEVRAKPQVLEQGHKNSLLVLAAYENDEMLINLSFIGHEHMQRFISPEFIRKRCK